MLKKIHYSALISLAIMSMLPTMCKADEQEQDDPKRRFTLMGYYPNKNATSIPIYGNLKKVLIWPTTNQEGGLFRYESLEGVSPGALALSKMKPLTSAKIKVVTNRAKPIYEWPEAKDKSTLLLWVSLNSGSMRYIPDSLSPEERSKSRIDPSYHLLAMTIRHIRKGHESKYCTVTLPHPINDKDETLKVIEGAISHCLEKAVKYKLVVPNQNSARSAAVE